MIWAICSDQWNGGVAMLKTLSTIASVLVIGCAGKSPLELAKAQSLDLSTIDPSWATCLGERAKDFDGGLGRCESAKIKTLKHSKRSF